MTDDRWTQRLHRIDKRLSVLAAVQRKDREAADAALRLQAGKYEQRLEILNHEAATLKAMQSTYWPREMAEAAIRDIGRDIADLRKVRDESTGKQAVVAFIVSILVGLLVTITNVVLFLR